MSENSMLFKVKRVTEKLIDILAVVLISGIFVLGLAQVFWRWILRHPIIWSEELINLTYVWICYLGWAIAERSDSHIRITALLNALPKGAQKWVQIFNHVLCIIFCVLMVVFGIKLAQQGARRTAVSFAMNYAVVYVMGPLMNFVIIFYEVAGIIECLTKGPRDYREKDGGDAAADAEAAAAAAEVVSQVAGLPADNNGRGKRT